MCIRDSKYIVVDKATKTVNGKTVVTYDKLDDAKDFMDQDDVVATNLLENTTADTRVNIGNNSNKKAEDLTEAYKISFTPVSYTHLNAYFLPFTVFKETVSESPCFKALPLAWK